MPAEMQVCNCNGVSKATIAACVAGGVRSAADVMNATRAGKGCGSCKSLVAEVVTWCSAGLKEDRPLHDIGGVEDTADRPALPAPETTIWAGENRGADRRTCKSCIGVDYCRFALGDSIGLAVKIERLFRDVDTPGKLELATAGCPRNCSEALITDVGAVAIGDGKWEIYVGGTGGLHAHKGDILCVVDNEDDVLFYAGRFTQFYRQNARDAERSDSFVARIGIERVRAIVVDDSEAIAAALDSAMQVSVEGVHVPRKEAVAPTA
jgi:NAD(P)H-nitrite reductase large subunit